MSRAGALLQENFSGGNQLSAHIARAVVENFVLSQIADEEKAPRVRIRDRTMSMWPPATHRTTRQSGLGNPAAFAGVEAIS
eukprot:scaffold823_cov397-Prasinococcus_capsulatus_cf.AAC.20